MKAMKKISVLFLALVLTASVFSGCLFESDEDAIKNVVSDFEKSVQTQNIDNIIKTFDPESASQVQNIIEQAEEFGMTKDELSSSFFSQLSSNPSSAKFTTENIAVSGDTATADVTLNADDVENSTSELRFIKIDGKWYIDATDSGLV